MTTQTIPQLNGGVVVNTLAGTELFECAPSSGPSIPVSTSAIGRYMLGAASTLIYPSGDTTGATDLANLQAAIATVAASFRLPPSSSSFCATGRLVLAPGTFYFTSGVGNLLGPTNTLKMNGIWIQGSGRGVTWIDYHPTVSGPFLINNHALEVKMSDISFVGHDANSDFLWSQEQAGISNVQDYTFVDVDWDQTWNTLFRLTGGNNNSEWKFARCTVQGIVANWMYTPPSVVATITSGSSTIAATNTASQLQPGDTGSFNASVAPLTLNTQYYVVNPTSTSFQVATTPSGTPVTFTANGTPNFSSASDQFLNFWFHQCKFGPGTGAGQWINMAFGGSIKIRDCDVSGRNPAAVSYLFNLLGTVHAGGVMNFEVDGFRVEHAGTNSRTIHSQWNSGSISFKNLDESSQAGRWPITNQYAFYEIINAQGPLITYTNSQLMGQHAYTNNVSNFNFENSILYQQVTLLENPSAANFISVTNAGNSGGFPRIRFSKCRNPQSAATVGYHEIVDTDLFWNVSLGGQTDTKQISCVGTNSDWPINGTSLTFRLPLNAMITRVRFWNPLGSAAAGAFQYTLQTTEATPTVLAGGIGTPMAGADSSVPIPASSMYVTTPNFVMTSDAARTFQIIDNAGRIGIYTRLYCLIDYIG